VLYRVFLPVLHRVLLLVPAPVRGDSSRLAKQALVRQERVESGRLAERVQVLQLEVLQLGLSLLLCLTTTIFSLLILESEIGAFYHMVGATVDLSNVDLRTSLVPYICSGSNFNTEIYSYIALLYGVDVVDEWGVLSVCMELNLEFWLRYQ
jgi:hypothetical protein